jgi:hypothetical protein
VNDIPVAGGTDRLNTCPYLKSAFEYTLGQTLTRCRYTAKLLDFLMMNRKQTMHLSGYRKDLHKNEGIVHMLIENAD